MTIIFQLTYDCNLRCSYCYQKDKRAETLNIKDALLLIDKLFCYLKGEQENIFSTYISDDQDEVFKSGIQFIFFGGEALLEYKKIEIICDYFLKKCKEVPDLGLEYTFEFRIDSNGVNYKNNPEVQKMQQKYGKQMTMAITLDGCKEAHDKNRVLPNGLGTFDIVVDSVKKYKDFHGTTPSNKITFTDDNLQYIIPTFQTLIELGYPEVVASYDEYHQCTREETENFYQALVKGIDWLLQNKPEFEISCLMKEFHSGKQIVLCGSTGHMITIAPGGILSNCQMMNSSSLDKSLEKETILGNVRDGITNLNMLNFLHHPQYFKPVQCTDCPIEFGCDFCPATNINKTGYVFKD